MRAVNVLIMILLAGATTFPVAAAETKFYTLDEFRTELDTMYRRLETDAYNLNAYTPKAELDRVHDRLRAGVGLPGAPGGSLTRFQVEQGLQLMAAAAHLGHARVEGVYADWAEYQKGGGRAFPLNLRLIAGRAYVAKNLSGQGRIRLGDEIVALDGQPMGQWLQRTRRHISAESTYMADSILEYDFPMYLWVKAGEQPSFKLTIRRKDEPSFVIDLPALSAVEQASEQAHTPPALDLDHPTRDARILPNGVGYLRPGPFYNSEAKTGADEWDVSGFKAFIDQSFHMFVGKGVKKLIVDLRGNPGGDSLFSDVMVSWFANRPYQFFSSFKVRVSEDAIGANRSRIENDAAAAGPISRSFETLYADARPGDVVEFTLPSSLPNTSERFKGDIFVLVDRHTYSNSVAVAATVQDFKFGLVLGEPTADFATTYGAMEEFTLPLTGLTVGFPKARIVRPSGDQRARGVTPDIAIATPIVLTADDEVLRRASEIAASRRDLRR